MEVAVISAMWQFILAAGRLYMPAIAEMGSKYRMLSIVHRFAADACCKLNVKKCLQVIKGMIY